MRRPRSTVRRPTVPAPVLVLGAIASVQTGAAIARTLFTDVGPAGAVLLRLGFAAVVVGAAVRPRPRAHGRAALAAAALFGVVLAAMNWSFYEAIARIPLGVAVTVEFVGPLTVAIAGSRGRLDLVWAGLAAGGVAMLTTGGGALPLAGIGLALLAGSFWAAYILVSQRVGRLWPGTSGLAVALLVAAVLLLPGGLVAAGSRLASRRALTKGLAVALLSSAIPYSLELSALRRLRAAVFGVLMSLEPAMAALAGYAILGQTLRMREWAAIVMVSIASAGATLARPAAVSPEPGSGPT